MKHEHWPRRGHFAHDHCRGEIAPQPLAVGKRLLQPRLQLAKPRIGVREVTAANRHERLGRPLDSRRRQPLGQRIDTAQR